MKATKTLALLLTLTAASILHGADPYAADTDAPAKIDGYRLVWHDEFDVDGKPNAENWSYETGLVRNHEAQFYQADNANCQDGLLIIEARKERVKNPKYDASIPQGGDHWQQTTEYANYTSASINTNQKRAFKYGRILVRARIPTASGAWPAIWTLGTKYDWPSNGEIDIMEFYRHAGTPGILANFCWSSSSGQWTGKWDSSWKDFSYFTNKDASWASKFHVWRMDWSAEKISIYLDDELLNDIETKNAINEGAFGWHWQGHCPFTQEHYILLNLALGGDNGGAIDDNAMPMTYAVDYVRVYQVGEEGEEPGTDDQRAFALDFTWSGTDGEFSDPTKWDGGTGYTPIDGDRVFFTKATESTVTLTGDAAMRSAKFSTENGSATTTVDLDGKAWRITTDDFNVNGGNAGAVTFKDGEMDFYGAKFANGGNGLAVTFDGNGAKFLGFRDKHYGNGTKSFYHDDLDGYSDKDVSFADAGKNCTFTLSGGAAFVTGRGFTMGDDWDNAPNRSTGNIVHVTGQGTVLQTNPYPFKEESGKRWGMENGVNRLPGAGSDNRLIVDSGATFAVSGKRWGTENANGGGTIMGLTSAYRNRIEVRDGGSFRIGNDGGRLVVGYWDACDNGIDVTGAGSTAFFHLTTVGFCHTTSNNFIRVANGASAEFATTLYLGGTDADKAGKDLNKNYDGNAIGSRLTVEGPNATCTANGSIYVGYRGSKSRLEVLDGGALTVNNDIFASTHSTASDNTILVGNATLAVTGSQKIALDRASHLVVSGAVARVTAGGDVSVRGGSTLAFVADEDGFGRLDAQRLLVKNDSGDCGLGEIVIDGTNLGADAPNSYTLIAGKGACDRAAADLVSRVRFVGATGDAQFDSATSTLSVTISGTTPPAPPKPSAPQPDGIAKVAKDDNADISLALNLFAAGSDANQADCVKAHWTTALEHDSYRLGRATSANGPFATVYSGNGGSFEDCGLDVGTTYYYRLEVVKGGNTVLSGLRTATPFSFDRTAMTARNLVTGATVPGANVPPAGPSGTLVDGVYYQWGYGEDANGRTLWEKSSTDGYTFSEPRTLLSATDASCLASCKLEAANVTWCEDKGVALFTAHWENASDYTNGKLFLATAVPGGAATFHGCSRPCDVYVRDMSVSRQSDATYLVAASNLEGEGANKSIRIFRFKDDLSAVESVVAVVHDNGYRESPHVVWGDGGYYLFTSQAAGWYPSAGAYAFAPAMEGPWSDARAIGDDSTFSSQSGWIEYIGGNRLVHGYRWMHASGTADYTLLPVVFDNGSAFYDYYPEILQGADGMVVPVADGANVAFGKSAKLVVNGGAEIDAANATDGDYRTAVKGTGSENWPLDVVIDLGVQHDLAALQCSWYVVKGSEGYYVYTIDASDDGTSWTTLLDRSDKDADLQKNTYGFSYDRISGQARYVRLHVLRAYLHNNPACWYTPSFPEVKVFGAPVLAPPPEEPVAHDPMTLTWSGLSGFFSDRTKWDENFAPANGDQPVFNKATESTATFTADVTTKAPKFSTENGSAATTVDLNGKTWIHSADGFRVNGGNAGAFTFKNGEMDFVDAKFANDGRGLAVTFDGNGAKFLAARNKHYGNGKSFYHDDQDGYSDKDVSFADAGRFCAFTLSGGAVFVTGRGFTMGDDWDNAPNRSTGNVVRVTGLGTIFQTNPYPIKDESGKHWGNENGVNRLPGAGSDNRLVIDSGATFAVSGKKYGTENANGGGTIMGLTSAFRNRIEVKNGGSFRIGNDGGRLIVGYWDACDNGIDVTGAGSTAFFHLTTVGYCHTTSNNFIRIADGASAEFTSTLYLGGTDADKAGKNFEFAYDGNAIGSRLTVEGPGTTCTANGKIHVGYRGSKSRLEVMDGGALTVNNDLSASSKTTASDNTILVGNATLAVTGSRKIALDGASHLVVSGAVARVTAGGDVSVRGGSTLAFVADEDGFGQLNAQSLLVNNDSGDCGLGEIVIDGTNLGADAPNSYTLIAGKGACDRAAADLVSRVRFVKVHGEIGFDPATSTMTLKVNRSLRIFIR